MGIEVEIGDVVGVTQVDHVVEENIDTGCLADLGVNGNAGVAGGVVSQKEEIFIYCEGGFVGIGFGAVLGSKNDRFSERFRINFTGTIFLLKTKILIAITGLLNFFELFLLKFSLADILGGQLHKFGLQFFEIS